MTRISRLAVTALVLFLASVAVHAHRDATGIVKQRMDAMTAMGDAMKALRAMMRGTQAYEGERVKGYAGAIARHAGEEMTALFPEGSLNHPTRAKPAIWTDWDRFAESARQLAMYADALAAAAFDEPARVRGGGRSSGGDVAVETKRGSGPRGFTGMAPDALFERLRQTCSDCHRGFRTKK